MLTQMLLAMNFKTGDLMEKEETKEPELIFSPSMIISQKNLATKHGIIFYWDLIGKNRGAFLNKLYGFNSKGKKYRGMIEKFSGAKLGKSCLIIPAEHKEEMIDFMKKHDVRMKYMEVFSE